MKQNNKPNNPMELSYYRLTLLSYLKESHPHLAADSNFIRTRADEAAEAYARAIQEGQSQIEAEELANLTLFKDLLFSKHDTIVNILWNEFADIIPQSQASDYARKLLPECESVFSRYNLHDELMYSPEYNRLYTELTGCIDRWLEEHEL